MSLMIAYAVGMSLPSFLRRMFSSRSQEGEAGVEEMEDLSGGAVMPGLAASEGAEAAEAQIKSQEAPPDPDS